MAKRKAPNKAPKEEAQLKNEAVPKLKTEPASSSVKSATKAKPVVDDFDSSDEEVR